MSLSPIMREAHANCVRLIGFGGGLALIAWGAGWAATAGVVMFVVATHRIANEACNTPMGRRAFLADWFVDGLWFWPILILEILSLLRVPYAEGLLMRAERRAGLF